MTHWALKYIGKPWICGKYDCWGLVREVYFNELGIELSPIITNALDIRQVFCEFAKTTNYSSFQQISELKNNAIVVLSQGKYPSHVGIWIDVDGGGILHNQRNIGVIFQKKTELNSLGWKITGIWEVRTDYANSKDTKSFQSRQKRGFLLL